MMKILTLNQVSIGILVSIATVWFFNVQSDLLYAQATNITSSGLNTEIHPNGTTTFIDGGTRPASGPNLFHSFQNFSVGEGHTALFRNSDGGVTSNILGRVTGGNVSNIFGTIDSATNFPQANLWLINPAGFLFGPTASLNVGGAVNISTADYLKLTDGNKFFADPSKNSVLSMDPVSAFGFLPSNSPSVPGITVQASDLRVRTGQTLSLVGNAFVDLIGARLTARAGRLNLVSVGPVDGTQGEVIASGSGVVSTVSTTGFAKLGSIRIDGVTLDTSSTSNTNNSGAIFIRGGETIIRNGTTIDSTNLGNTGKGAPIDIEGAHIVISDSALKGENGGLGEGSDVRIKASGSFELAGGISVSAPGGLPGKIAGNAGNILIRAKDILLDTYSRLTSHTNARGRAGSITLIADNDIIGNGIAVFSDSSDTQEGQSRGAGDITLQGRNVKLADADIRAESFNGNAGTIRLTAAETFSVDNNGSLNSTNFGSGKGGDILIGAQNVKLTNTEIISENISNGQPGRIQITATETMTAEQGSVISTQAQGGVGRFESGGIMGGGLIQVEAKNIILRGGAEIVSGTSGGGPAGQIKVVGTEQITLQGSSPDGRVSGLLATTTGTYPSATGQVGQGGNIEVRGNTLLIDGGTINNTTSSKGPGGNIIINAEHVMLRGDAQVSSNSILADPTAGRAGEIGIQGPSGIGSTARTINLNGSKISTTVGGGTMNTGAASITIAAQTVALGSRSHISANTTGNASAGNIRLTAQQLSLSADSDVSTNAQGEGQGPGGVITINGIESTPTAISGGMIQAQSATVAKAGNIDVRIDGDLSLQGTTLSVKNTGTGSAGSIILNSGNNLVLKNSQVSTESAKASGGTMTLKAPNTIVIADSSLTSSVKGQVGSNSGNILIDPLAVVIQDSTISATANAGAGGLINVAASGAVLVDPNSKLDATAGPAGISGRVNINAPIQVLSGTLVPLKMVYSQPALSSDRCAADSQGRFSSFVHTGRDGVPSVPGAYIASPLLPLDQLMFSSQGIRLPNLTAARLGLDSLKARSSQFQSACRS